MKGFDEGRIRGLTEAVKAVERESGLEVVIRIVPRASAYDEVRYAAACGAGLLALVLMVVLPVVVSPVWLAPEVVAAAFAAWWVAGKAPVVRRLTRHGYREARVITGARDCFVGQAISGTKDRTGVLVYVSVLEDRIFVLPDLGAQGAAPEALWADLDSVARDQPLFERAISVLQRLAELGLAHVPRRADDTNELADEPIVG